MKQPRPGEAETRARFSHFAKAPRQRGLGFAVGPIEPRQQRGDVRRFDRGAGPDADAGRRVAVGAEVVRDAVLLQQSDQPQAVPLPQHNNSKNITEVWA